MTMIDVLVESFYVSLEELRSYLGSIISHVNEGQLQLRIPTIEKLTKALVHATLDLCSYGVVTGYNNDNDEDDDNAKVVSHKLILSDCYQKACLVVMDCIRWICRSNTSNSRTGSSGKGMSVELLLPDGGPETQAAIAQILEYAIEILASSSSQNNNNNNNMNNAAINELQQLYSIYQKNLLRQRCKPSVANIVNIRTAAQRRSLTVHQLLLQYSSEAAALTEIEGDDHDEEHFQQKKQEQQEKLQPHMYALTTILTEATHLLHPLGCWYDAIIPHLYHITQDETTVPKPQQEEALLRTCHDAICILDQEVQILCSRVGTWFIQDREISFHLQQQQHLDMQFLDAILLEELSYVCQLLSRYCEFVSQCCSCCCSSSEPHPLLLLAQEYIGYYSSLEHSLYNTNLQRAIDIAKPVEIYDGIFVSSLVEDSFYLSKKTLERAKSTKNDQALLTITNRICESWKDVIFNAIASGEGSSSSTTITLQHQQQQLSNQELAKKNKNVVNSNNNNRDDDVMNIFTAAFLDALDEDMCGPTGTAIGPTDNKVPLGSTGRITHQSPPSSFGGRISISTSTNNSLDWQITTCMCTLNSIASASSACLAISLLYKEIIDDLCQQGEVIDDDNNSNSTVLLEQNSTKKMLDFTREEWLAHSKEYSMLLSNKAQDEVHRWCGIPFQWSIMDEASTSTSSGNSFLITKMLNIENNNNTLLLPLQRIQKVFAKQNYKIVDADTYYKVESDSVLIPQLIDPLRTCPLISQITLHHCEQSVSVEVAILLTTIIAQEIILPMIFVGVGPTKTKKMFTDWGALLFSKQVRLLQNELCSLLLLHQNPHHCNNNESKNVEVITTATDAGSPPPINYSNRHFNSSAADAMLSSTAPILAQMEGVTQVVTILQLEKPGDWTSLQYAISRGQAAEAQLTKEEIGQVMTLRVGFSKEAIAALCDAM